MTLIPDLVLFDCDGVLVDSEHITTEVICADLKGHGLDISADRLIDLFLGGTIAGILTSARDMGADLSDTWVEEIYAKVFAALEANVEPIPGIFDVLDALDAAGIGYAVGSNGPHAKMEISLTRTGLMPRLKGRVYSREDVPNPKPAPDVYLKAARDAGIPPERCVVIEDSDNGARAGKAAGMRCFGFTADTDPARLAPICDELFASMKELPKLLGI